MHHPEPPDLESLSSAQAEWINEVCNEFAKAWGIGARPEVRDYMNRVGDHVESVVKLVLLRELLTTELEFRQNDAKAHDLDAYTGLFTSPGETEVVEFVLDGLTKADTTRRFRVLRPHARGALGEVFVAHDRQVDRLVALKKMNAELADDETSRARFKAEAEITGQLAHPGIPPVYATGFDRENRLFYAMRLIEGKALGKAINDYHNGNFPGSTRRERERAPRSLLGNLIALCNILAFAHNQGVLHRDVKPDNVMLGEYGETILVDWGLAKVIGTPASDPISGLAQSHRHGGTGAGWILGTLPYMSPEQAEPVTELVGPAGDVYSLGATLYHLVTGRVPFVETDDETLRRGLTAGDGDTDDEDRKLLELRRRVIIGDFLPPRKVARGVPRALDAIVLKAMAHKPDDRYKSATQLAEDIEDWLAGEPVSAYPEPFPKRLARWARRHRTLVTSVASVVLIALAGLGAFSLVLTGKNRELGMTNIELVAARADAEKQRDQAKQVTEFLVSSFRKPDPEQDGRNVTVAEVLGRAVKGLDQKKIDPITRATFMSAVGTTYRGLGLVPEAVAVLEDALSISRQELGEDDLGTLTVKTNLAVVYQDAGQLHLALPLFEEVLAARRRKQGEDHTEALESKNNLAVAYQAAGRVDLAVSTLVQVLESCRIKLGDGDLMTLKVKNNLGMAYHDARRLDRAIPLLEETFAARRVRLGDDHLDTLVSRSNLAGAYLVSGRADRSVPLFEQVLAQARTKLGEDHTYTLGAMNQLALAYREIDQVDRAIPLFERAAEGRRIKLGEDHPSTVVTQSYLARAYEKAHRYRDAEVLYRRVVEVAGRRKPRDDHMYSELLARLGSCLIQEQNYEAAVVMLRESLEIKDRIEPDAWTTPNARSILGEALAGLKDFRGAESLLLNAQKALMMRQDKMYPLYRGSTLRDAVDRLVRLYEAWGKPADADHWRKTLPPEPNTTAPRSSESPRNQLDRAPTKR